MTANPTEKLLPCNKCSHYVVYLVGHNLGDPYYKFCGDCNGKGYTIVPKKDPADLISAMEDARYLAANGYPHDAALTLSEALKAWESP